MPDIPQSGAFEEIISQLLVVFLVLLTFFAGLWARGALEEGEDSLTRKQLIATCLVGFVIMGLPLTKMVHSALDAAGSDALIVVLTACVPPFASGFTAREQIKKWLNGPRPEGKPEPASGALVKV